MVILCQVCESFRLTVDSFASRTTHLHDRSSTGCTGKHERTINRGTDCNGQCDHSTIQLLTIRPFVDIRHASAKCTLCQLICTAVEECFSARTRHPELKCELKTKRHRGYYNLEKNYKILEVSLDDGTANRAVEKPTLDLLPVISSDERYEGFFTGKQINPACIDMVEVNSWIQECRQHHGGPCRPNANTGFDNIRQILRVLDVERDCLVSLPDGGEYTALSYVWGTSKREFRTTCQNLSIVTQSGGLTPFINDLPLVILDAILVTKSIGARYLWVDRLCIVQNDDTEKEMVIPKMNLVYENAFITFFSCGWGDASGGLTGVRPSPIHRRQISARIAPGLELMMPHNLEAMLHSPWAARGWTFQEFFSAKRKLLFINGQATMICRNGSYREDLTRCHVNLTQRFKRLGPQEWQPPLKERSNTELRESFMKYVEEYTKRNLSYDSDALNAFAGVINFFRDNISLASTAGIPNATFGLDLLWNAVNYLKRRSGFPSWSWVGWIGSIRMSKCGIPLPRGKSTIRTQIPRNRAWLMGLYFLAFYIYDQQSNSVRLVSDEVHDQNDNQQGAGPPTPVTTLDFPLVDLSRDISFDPRHEELSGLRTMLGKVISTAPPKLALPSFVQERPNQQILYFRTITATVFISTNGPPELEAKQPTSKSRGDSFEDKSYPSSHHVYLEDTDGQLLGLAWLFEEEAHNRLRLLCKTKDECGQLRRAVIKVAVVSGPVVSNWRLRGNYPDIDMGVIMRSADAQVEQFSTDHQTETRIFRSKEEHVYSIPSTCLERSQVVDLQQWPNDKDMDVVDWGKKYCHVMLLGHSGELLYEKQAQHLGILERIGIGEINEDLLCKMKETGVALWEGVYLR